MVAVRYAVQELSDGILLSFAVVPKSSSRSVRLQRQRAHRLQRRGLKCICNHAAGRHSETRGRCWLCDECPEFLLGETP